MPRSQTPRAPQGGTFALNRHIMLIMPMDSTSRRRPSAKKGRPPVLAEQRQSLIATMVNQRGSLSITEIHRKLKVSRETIRRDLLLLADRNLLRKTHGGALSLERS